MRKMGIGLGVGINRSNYAQGIFSAYQSRVIADGGVTEAGTCVDAVSSLLQSASLLLIPSGYKGGKLYAEIPTNGNGDLTWTRASDAWRTNSDGLIQRVPWNLLQQSNAFTTSPWSFVGTPTLTSNYATNPLTGANDAWRFQSASSSHRVIQVISNSLTTFSVYAKGTGTIQLRDSTGNYTVDVALTSSWQRVTLYIPASFSNVQITSNGGCDATIYGAQLVEGTTAQTYLPTTDRLNFPRLSYMYGSCPSALLEPQRTNVCLQSENYDVSPWIKGSASGGSTPIVTLNYGISPSGLQNASRVQLTRTSTAGSYSYLYQAITVTSGVSYTWSVWLKSLSGTPTIALVKNGSYTNIVTLTTDWKRYEFTATSSSTSVECCFLIFQTLGTTSLSADFLAWGFQLEAGAYPTTYIPTTSGATATRVADSFSRNNIYTNGLISASGGTWFVELRNNISYQRDANNGMWLGDSTSPNSGNQIMIRNGTTSGLARLSIVKYISGASTFLYSTTTETVKFAIKWNGSTADVFVNGTKEVSATAFTTTLMENLSGVGSSVPFFIQQMALFPTPLSDTDCTTLTTL